MCKEPNGTLVMTTCKCRENTKNIVMTRTYFNEMLDNKIAWGAKLERQRIIELLLKHEVCGVDTKTNLMLNEDALIALIEWKPND